MADEWKPPPFGTPCWMGIPAKDVGRASQFYDTVFKLPFKEQPDSYPKDRIRMFDFNPALNLTGGIHIAPDDTGSFTTGKGGVCLNWFVEDVDAIAEVIEKAGGKMLSEKVKEVSQFSPSYIAFTDNGPLFGEAAKLQAGIDPRNAVFGIRRLIGREFSDIEAEIEHLPFKVVSKKNRPLIEVDLARSQKHFTPEELYGLILKRIKETVEDYLRTEVSMAIITYPTSFNDEQRDAIKISAELVGLDVPRLVTEPRAAGIAHKLDKGWDETNYLVYDFDDDTLSLHVVETDQGVLEILATANDITLTGGARNVEVHDFQDGLNDADYELVKMESLDSFNLPKTGSTTDDIFRRSLPSLERVLKSSNLTKEDMSDLILVGSSSHIPKLQPLLEEYLGVKASHVIEPTDSYAIGAINIARLLLSEEIIGCDFSIFDVCPLSLGIETTGGIMTKIIPRNTPYPTLKRQIFTTATNNQTTVLLKVYQGDRGLVRNNILLGKFELSLPPSPRGVPVIEVRFEVDNDFTLRVTARDLKSGMEETIITQAPAGLESQDLTDFLLREAEEHYREDAIAWDKPTPIILTSDLRRATTTLPNILSAEHNHIPILMLAWAYILSARWAELIQAAHLLQSGSHQTQQSTTEGSKMLANDKYSITVRIGEVSEDAAHWWRDILSGGGGWEATIRSAKGEVLHSPWSTKLISEQPFVISAKVKATSSPSKHIPATSAIAHRYLSEYCRLHDIDDQKQAALAAALLIPVAKYDHRPIELEIPKFSHEVDRGEEICIESPLIIENELQLDRLLTLSCNPRGSKALLTSIFFEPDITSNICGFWLQGSLAFLDTVKDPHTLLRTLIKRDPELGILWLGAFITGTHHRCLRDARAAWWNIDLNAAAWTGTFMSFIQAPVPTSSSEGGKKIEQRKHASLTTIRPKYGQLADHGDDIDVDYDGLDSEDENSEMVTRNIFTWLRGEDGFPIAEREIREHQWIDNLDDDDDALIKGLPAMEKDNEQGAVPVAVAGSSSSLSDTHRPRRRRLSSQLEAARTSTACQICRDKKVKCSGTWPCRYCSKRRLNCVFSASEKRKMYSVAFTGPGPGCRLAARTVETPHSETSAFSLLTQRVANEDQPPGSARAPNRELINNVHGWPSEEEANQLLELVTLNVGISQHLFDIRSFSDNLARLYHDTGNETPLRGLWFVQVLFVLALGRLLRAGTDDDLEVPGVAFFNEAMRHMPAMSDIGKHGILGIEVIGLAALFLQVADRKDEAYLYVRRPQLAPEIKLTYK
ncbi:hypothetical protein G7Z17_g9990 [Cylindrodendrum hubeiense]|uniref:non-chaperonin molecular chaperone ATPase n=1 Tax=Cylindrodendrum hubeiense TaxID=595255 RepID=A0A9P5LCS7_9HYPO|nr:hypothetical protein G7Z17_g9990 [Cylindrodendrum hubeiense]